MSLKLKLRRRLNTSLRFLLRLRSTTYTSAGPVALVIAPHTDDEVFGCGGLIAQKRSSHHVIHIVYVTDSSASHLGHPTLTRNRLEEIRHEEARAALQLLGVDGTTVHYLKAEDGSLDSLTVEQATHLVARLRSLIDQIKPNEIYVPYRRDGSSEHEAIFRLLKEAQSATTLRPLVYEFLVWSWWSPTLLCRALLTARAVIRCDISPHQSLKRKAIGTYRSQIAAIPPWPHPVLPEGFADFFDSHEEFFVRGDGF